jgi:hypothetical protein
MACKTKGRELLHSPALFLPLLHPSAWNRYSPKFTCRILHIRPPIPPKSRRQTPRYAPARCPLVTPMHRYARLRMLAYYKH